jgi:hypothetical protein
VPACKNKHAGVLQAVERGCRGRSRSTQSSDAHACSGGSAKFGRAQCPRSALRGRTQLAAGQKMVLSRVVQYCSCGHFCFSSLPPPFTLIFFTVPLTGAEARRHSFRPSVRLISNSVRCGSEERPCQGYREPQLDVFVRRYPFYLPITGPPERRQAAHPSGQCPAINTSRPRASSAAPARSPSTHALATRLQTIAESAPGRQRILGEAGKRAAEGAEH